MCRIPDDVVHPLRHLQEQLFTFLLPRITLGRGSVDGPLDASLLGLWWHLLTLRRWLGVDTSQTPFMAMTIASRVLSLRTTPATEECTALLAIALEELHIEAPDGSRHLHLDFIVAAYLSISRCEEVKPHLDAILSKASRALRMDDYDTFLDTIADGLGDETLSTQNFSNLIHLLSLMLHDPPEGTVFA